MTTTRWKLTAGGLVLALGGLAAVAGVPARSCQPEHKAGPVVLVEAPVPIPVAPVLYQPPADAPTAPAIPPAPVVPAVSTPAEASVFPLPVVTAEAKSEPKPPPKEDKVFELTVPAAEPVQPASSPPPAPTGDLEPAGSPPALPVAKPFPPPELKPTPTPTPAPAPPSLPAPKPTPPAPKPTPTWGDPLLNTKPDPAPTVVETKLKVCLRMGDERPRFEVRDGDEVYLKVVCDKVDVKSPSDRGETMSTLRATGRVTFVTPGGDGTCDELTVIPGTGQVVVAGRVSFKYNWGKVETTVSGEKMTFRLGSTPSAGPVTVQASHRTR
ncbi:MAG TPA: hypothetical protein VFG68_19770 [Fimbriiglobus sp.]|nr:hypothetical protein [Fimbriiglobus sp.]